MPNSSVARLWLISQRQLQRSDKKAGFIFREAFIPLRSGGFMSNSKHISCFFTDFLAELVELAVCLIQKC
jgi:hypothetical protein